MPSSITSYTITCSRPTNYGAVLQTYGLNTALCNLGATARVIDYNPEYYRRSTLPFVKRIARNIVRTPDFIKGNKVFGRFLEQYVPMSPRTYTNDSELNSNPPQADLYIAGSDQIWNCLNKENGNDDAFFLTFASSSTRRITYAASLAMPAIPENQRERYRCLISNLDQVSVREPSAVPILEEIGITDVSVVPDPAFLLEADEWNSIAEESQIPLDENYVLVYGYNRQKNVYSYAQTLAHELHAKLYVIGTAIEDYTLPHDRYFWNASPNTFVNLIRNAKSVVTNSFHGTVFSVIYNVPFHFFTVQQTTNSRMLDLLETLDLSSRHVTGHALLPNEMDFAQANHTVQRQRAVGRNYLSSNIQKAATR